MTEALPEGPLWGPTGETVYTRTYQRTKADGTKESWLDTVTRVVDGNLGLVDARHIEDFERDKLIDLFYNFRALPAGRHLWASGVKGRQYLFNCHVSGWDAARFSDHFEFTFMRLMEGGGVGANYSSRFLAFYPEVTRALKVHVVCDPDHPDYGAMRDAGVLSEEFSADWDGAYPVEDSREGWASALVDLLDTFYRPDVEHTDRVYDVSRVRAAGSRLKTFGGTASGPLPFARMMGEVGRIMSARAGERATSLDAMEIDHAIAECVVSGGVRRSARMSILHWADPQIEEFIRCKTDTGKHWTTNISVEVDHEFFLRLKSVKEDGSPLPTGRKAWAVLNAVAEGMLTNGEPGLWNSTYANVGEPNEVVSTNPCGEIALEAWENCNLGHVNLEAFASSDTVTAAALLEAHRLMARFLIRATYGDVTDPKQAAKLAANRRIGVGHFGVQGFLAKNGQAYSSAPDSAFPMVLDSLYRAVREAARDYAFELRIPEPVKVTTVAPTGSIAKMPGATEGIHPIYARYFLRRVRFSDVGDAEQIEALRAEGYKVEPDQYAAMTSVVEFPTKEKLVGEVEALGLSADLVESADEISLESMLAFQAMYQDHYADNAVSFTVNVPDGKYGVAELSEALARWLPLLKGTTLMVDATRPQSPYERITEEQYLAATVQTTDASYDDDCATGACPVR